MLDWPNPAICITYLFDLLFLIDCSLQRLGFKESSQLGCEDRC
jgi:hypothetical protein